MRMKTKQARAVCIFLFSAIVALLTGTAATGTDRAVTKGTVFDMAHSEIFSPVQEGPLHYGSLYGIFKGYGPVGTNEKLITPKVLEGVKTYVVAGPAVDFTRDDQIVLQKFVRDGGNLLVLMHIAPPVARLTERFGIIASNFVISEQEGTIKGQSQDFFVTRFEPHPVTRGLKKVAVYGTWGLLTDVGSGSKTIASTSEKAWADMNRNRALDKGEPVQQFGIVAAGEHGRGKIVVVADDAPFANRFIGEADNRKLAENIAKWFNE